MRPSSKAMTLVLAIAVGSPCIAEEDTVLDLCSIFERFGEFRGKTVLVRALSVSTPEVTAIGVGKRCQARFRTGAFEWPSMLWISEGSGQNGVARPLVAPEAEAVLSAPRAKGTELWITLKGTILARDQYPIISTPGGPRGYGFGHLAMFPGEILVIKIVRAEVVQPPLKPK